MVNDLSTNCVQIVILFLLVSKPLRVVLNVLGSDDNPLTRRIKLGILQRVLNKEK